MAYPTLDREAARRDPSVIDRWEQKVELLYKAELAGIDLAFSPQDEAGVRPRCETGSTPPVETEAG